MVRAYEGVARRESGTDDLDPAHRLRIPLPEADIRQILIDLTEQAQR